MRPLTYTVPATPQNVSRKRLTGRLTFMGLAFLCLIFVIDAAGVLEFKPINVLYYAGIAGFIALLVRWRRIFWQH